MICTISRIKILSVLSFLCQLSVVVLLKTILACPVIPFFLIPTFATCDGDEGKTHEVSPLFTFLPLSPAPHALLTISHHCESSTITGKSLSNPKVLFSYVRNVLVLWIYQCNVSGVAEHKWIDTWSSFPYCVPFRVFLVKLTDWRANEALEERRLSDWLILWLMVPMDNTTWNSHQKLRTVSRQVKVRIWGLPLHACQSSCFLLIFQ